MYRAMRGPDYILDIDGVTPPKRSEGASRPGTLPGAGVGRAWIAIKWTCCGAYSRVYRNRAGTAYEGRCPRCGKATRANIGEGGTSARFFEAG